MAVLQHLGELIALLVIVSGPVPLAIAVLQTYQSSARTSLAYSLLCTLTVWSVLQITLGIGLGSWHQLTLTGVMVTEMIVLTLGWLFGIALKAPPWQSWCRSSLRLQRPLQAPELIVLASIFLVGTLLLEKIATQPITNFDSLWFHLPAVARWYQTGSLTLLDPAGYWIFEHPDAANYPLQLAYSLGSLFTSFQGRLFGCIADAAGLDNVGPSDLLIEQVLWGGPVL